MDIKTVIENNIGEPLFISKVGSHVYGTSTAESDNDYFAVVKSNSDIPINKNSNVTIDNYDIFYLPYQSIENMACCSSALFVGDLVNVIYAKDELHDFIKSNKFDLMNIAPSLTYISMVELIEHDFHYKLYKRIIIMADILKQFSKTKDFSKCFPVSDECKAQVMELINGKEYTEEELKSQISFIYEDSFKSCFNVASNSDLHKDFYELILKLI